MAPSQHVWSLLCFHIASAYGLLPCLTGLDKGAVLASLQKPSSLLASDPPAPVFGPYAVKDGTIDPFPGLELGKPHTASIWYPMANSSHAKRVTGASDGSFPFLSFAHGATEGSLLPPAAKVYPLLFKLVASYGFVIVAPNSCTGMCYDYYKDQLHAMEQCYKNRSLHVGLAKANFSRTGVFGHSMGAMASIPSAGGFKGINTTAHNITASVSMHPCGNPFLEQQPSLIDVPILFTAGSDDIVCEDQCALDDWKKVVRESHIFFDVEGIGHMDPTFKGHNYEIQVVTYFLTCHVRGEHCDKIYGASGKAICEQPFKLSDCRVENGTQTSPYSQ